jgi:hypothetical protein
MTIFNCVIILLKLKFTKFSFAKWMNKMNFICQVKLLKQEHQW